MHVLVFEPGALLRQEVVSADERGSCSVKKKRFVQNMRGCRSQAGRVAPAELRQHSRPPDVALSAMGWGRQCLEGGVCIESPQDMRARSPPQRCLKAAVSYELKICLALTCAWKCPRDSRGGDTALLSGHQLWEDAGSALGSLCL